METDYRVLVMDLPTTVKGFVFMDSTNTPVIVLNARMTQEIQQRTFFHELLHIQRGDMDNFDYREYAS